jgi:purine nucleoside permease
VAFNHEKNLGLLNLLIAEINAASTLTALTLSTQFGLASTYFLVAGISGGNPHSVTTGSVTFPRFAVQFDLQYEFDARQVPANASTSYYPQGAYYPDTSDPIDYPGWIYGTEVFELNVNLRDHLYSVASLATLNDTQSAQEYRATYGYPPANQPPSFVKCDSVTSNDYVSGSILGNALTNFTLLMTNGTGNYCGTQQEDNATLEALLRAAMNGYVDFSRIALMRTISDFDRAPPDETEVFHLLYADQQGFTPSIDNIYQAGIEIVKDIRKSWYSTYRHGLKPGNYIGDLFNSLDYPIVPDIG